MPTLQMIDPMAYDRGKWLWDHVRKLDACFDDFSCDENGPIAELFARRLASPQTVAFEFGDLGLITVEDIVPRLGASIHFFCWGDVDDSMREAGRQAIDFTMETYLLRRLTAAPPEYNRLAKRLVVELGFSPEGRMRHAFLKHERYWDILLYGLIKENEYGR
jgi:hypothetical protein